MDDKLRVILSPYNPWWDTVKGIWREDIPLYRRTIVERVISDIEELPQIVSVTGPRRVGKTTALRQVICHLLDNKSIAPERVLYFSFDDSDMFVSSELQREIFDRLVAYAKGKGATKEVPFYFFLDEIKRLPRWSFFLKKYYDLKFPARFIISGSASSAIFRQSQESLLGRIKDRHLLPFSFREFCFYKLRYNSDFSSIVGAHSGMRQSLMEGNWKEIVTSVRL